MNRPDGLLFQPPRRHTRLGAVDRGVMELLLVLTLFLPTSAASQAIDASRLAVSTPRVITELTGDDLPGLPLRLAWSPDGSEVYLRLVRRDRWANETVWHSRISIRGGRVRLVENEPAWASVSWASKSAYHCPGAADFKVDLEIRTERRTATGSGAGGSIAQNSGDPYGPGSELGPQGQAIIAGAMQSQFVTTATMKVKGQWVSEFVNAEPRPGLMFGWAPEGFDALAYGDRKRRLVVMDRAGHRHEVSGTRSVLLPAWSPDGSRLAWLEARGRNTFALVVADVTKLQ